MRVIIFGLFLLLEFLYLSACTHPVLASNSYEECVAENGQMLKTIPSKCVNSEGQVFVKHSEESSKGRLCEDLCGNGQCEEIVCMGQGCPCAENANSCPSDCSKN
ncbi:MAG: hypothetical protein GYA55_14375 [SAR324 cluster bacterium]|uniref:Uncharacterized protein n=1 Tax=SAR324 cluster bacterium TaxID=2024889 RepID=A0A7X9ILK4_9DELT|nr:hypothetical protein [SAR324 cluster bacterium]